MASENAKAIAEDREDLIREIEEKTEVFKKLCEKQRGLLCREDKLWDYIYLIKCNNFYKIGHTFNLDSRLNTFQTGNPYTLEIYLAIKHPKAVEIEYYLQEIFIKKKVKREWFEFSEEDIIKIKNLIENYDKKKK